MNKDQRSLEDIYSRKVLSENIKEPKFVQDKPHLPTITSPREGDINVMDIIKRRDDKFEKILEVAKKILDHELKQKKYNINFEVLKRDNFGNINADEYKDGVNALAKFIKDQSDKGDQQNVDAVHMTAQDIAKRISIITNRFNYNPESQISNMADMNNRNADNVYAGQQFPAESTLNYLSATFEKKVINEETKQTQSGTIPTQTSTLSYLGKGK